MFSRIDAQRWWHAGHGEITFNWVIEGWADRGCRLVHPIITETNVEFYAIRLVWENFPQWHYIARSEGRRVRLWLIRPLKLRSELATLNSGLYCCRIFMCSVHPQRDNRLHNPLWSVNCQDLWAHTQTSNHMPELTSQPVKHQSQFAFVQIIYPIIYAACMIDPYAPNIQQPHCAGKVGQHCICERQRFFLVRSCVFVQTE